MRAIVNLIDLKCVIKASKGFASTGYVRSPFKHIALYFNPTNKMMTAVAVDGYKMSVESVTCKDIDEAFTIYITEDLPFTDDEGDVIIERHDDKAYLETFSCKKMYLQDDISPLDYETLIPKFKTKYRIAFNPKLLIDALKTCRKGSTVVLELDTSNNLSPLLIKNEFQGLKLVMPCRLHEEGKNGEN